jgi:hypothetical protein
MDLRNRHEIDCVEEVADRDLLRERPAARLAKLAGEHRALLVVEPYRHVPSLELPLA